MDYGAELVDDATRFGAVSSGYLQIRGRTVNGKLIPQKDPLNPRISFDVEWPAAGTPEGSCSWESLHDLEYFPDAQEPEFTKGNPPTPLVIFILGISGKGSYAKCRCLVLKQISGSLYSRYGRLEITEKFRNKAKSPRPHTNGDGEFYEDLCLGEEAWNESFPIETLTII